MVQGDAEMTDFPSISREQLDIRSDSVAATMGAMDEGAGAGAAEFFALTMVCNASTRPSSSAMRFFAVLSLSSSSE